MTASRSVSSGLPRRPPRRAALPVFVLNLHFLSSGLRVLVSCGGEAALFVAAELAVSDQAFEQKLRRGDDLRGGVGER